MISEIRNNDAAKSNWRSKVNSKYCVRLAWNAVAAIVFPCILLLPYLCFLPTVSSAAPFWYYVAMDRKFLVVVLCAGWVAIIGRRLPARIFSAAILCVFSLIVSAQAASVRMSGAFLDKNAFSNVLFIMDILTPGMVAAVFAIIVSGYGVVYWAARNGAKRYLITFSFGLGVVAFASAVKPNQVELERLGLQVSSPLRSLVSTIDSYRRSPYKEAAGGEIHAQDIGAGPLPSMADSLPRVRTTVLLIGESLTNDLMSPYNSKLQNRAGPGVYERMLRGSVSYANYIGASYSTINGMATALTGRLYIGAGDDFYSGIYPDFGFTLPKHLRRSGIKSYLLHSEPSSRTWMRSLFRDKIGFDSVLWCDDIAVLAKVKSGLSAQANCTDNQLYAAAIEFLKKMRGVPMLLVVKNNETHFPASPPAVMSSTCQAMGGGVLSTFCNFEENVGRVVSYLDTADYYRDSSALILTGDHPFQRNSTFRAIAGDVVRDAQFGRVPLMIYARRKLPVVDSGLVTSVTLPYVVDKIMAQGFDSSERRWLGISDLVEKYGISVPNKAAIAANNDRFVVYRRGHDGSLVFSTSDSADAATSEIMNKYFTTNRRIFSNHN